MSAWTLGADRPVMRRSHCRSVRPQGYLRQVVRRPDLFTPEHVATIFGNIEELHRFQSEFLRRLEGRVDHARPHASCIGAAFVEFVSVVRRCTSGRRHVAQPLVIQCVLVG